jgi:hypothetical protein
MKPRHAVALALIGWYLMTPPIIGVVVTAHAPLRQWRIVKSYDSAGECEKDLDDDTAFSEKVAEDSAFRERAWRRDAPTLSRDDYDATVGAFLYTVCIASDDPRLKR